MSRKDIRLNQLMRIYIDGIPLDMASSCLPFRTWFSFSLLNHIHLHARSQSYFADKKIAVPKHKVSHLSFLGLIDSLESAVKKLKWRLRWSEWSKYYENTNYSQEALEHKSQIVSAYINEVSPESVWDIGANEGVFSRIASKKGIKTISFDIDPAAVEKSYLKSVQDGETEILPLIVDLFNPSASIGWANEERMSLIERGPSQMVLALALIHHLAISNNGDCKSFGTELRWCYEHKGL